MQSRDVSERSKYLILGVCLPVPRRRHTYGLQSAAAPDRRSRPRDGTIKNFFDAPVGSGIIVRLVTTEMPALSFTPSFAITTKTRRSWTKDRTVVMTKRAVCRTNSPSRPSRPCGRFAQHGGATLTRKTALVPTDLSENKESARLYLVDSRTRGAGSTRPHLARQSRGAYGSSRGHFTPGSARHDRYRLIVPH